MAVQKSYKERLADQAKHRADMKVKRAAAKKVKAERRAAKDVKKATKTKALAAKRKALKERRAKKAGPVYKAPKYEGAPSPSKAPKKAAPQSFGKAFSSARTAGKKTFSWKGKSYTTKTADDAKKAKAKKPDVREMVKSVAKEKSRTSVDKYGTKTSAENGFSEEREDVIKKDKAARAKAAKAKADAASRKASQKVGEEIKREGMQAGGMVAPPTEPSIAPQPAYKEGGKVESNPYGWPTRDARSGLSEKK